MQFFFLIFLLGLLLFVSYQDFKQRSISWWTLPAILCFYGLYTPDFNGSDFKETLMNLGFIALNWALITLYFSIKNRKLVMIMDQYLGWGDLLFFVVCAGMFSTLNFICFLCFSFIVTLLIQVSAQLIRKEVNPEIPLAGIMALLLSGIMIIDVVLPGNLLRETSWVNNWWAR